MLKGTTVRTNEQRDIGEQQGKRREFLTRSAMLLGAVGAGVAAGPALAAKPHKDEDAALHEATARLAILDGLARYCRGFDRLDHELLVGVFHPDATAQYLDDPKTPFLDSLTGGEKYIRSNARSSHQIANVHIKVDGKKAVSEGYGCAVIQSHPENGKIQQTTFRGRYIDRWEERDGKWAIIERRYVCDVYQNEEIPVDKYPAFAVRDVARDRTDPSYAFIG